MTSKESADQDVAANSATEDTPVQDQAASDTWMIDGVETTLTPLQYHHISLLHRIIALKNEYQTDPDYEKWKMDAINKSIYSSLRDSIEANVGDLAKDLLHREHQVN